ncbi:unnamed protein product [Cladocopium goreaui]|uniref:alpha-amylase n=1 Tax=Cladocopium goreaui TaxID=2562237 RepID=A0A9P1DEP3_9DINO|nr:unnamed protein product [Cladocopium goreaui]
MDETDETLRRLSDAVVNLDSGVPFPVISVWLCLAWPLPTLFFWLAEYFARRRRVTAEGSEGTDGMLSEPLLSPMRPTTRELIQPGSCRVMCASLEHSIPHLRCKAQAGGLGKVMDLVARHHPTDILMIHPKVKDLTYRHDFELPPLRITVDDHEQLVRVFYSKPADSESLAAIKRGFLLLSHPWFEERDKKSIYPNPMSRRKVLCFYSLWNQCVGKLLHRYKPHVYHCPDFHACIAPWYALQNQDPADPAQLRMLLVLHNAEYQGSVSTDMIRERQCEKVARIFNMSEDFIFAHLTAEGRFNMLKAGVDFLLAYQEGQGAYAVSQFYAAECHARYSIFWQLPSIGGIDNPMLEDEREADLLKDLSVQKAEAKRQVQSEFGLNVDPDARLFVSLGRLVRQKGVDILADVAEWLLRTYPDAQLLVIGPPADGFGYYAQRRLEALAAMDCFEGRLVAKCEFIQAPPSLKWGADFCLMPSRDEPFGYVDIEFAWRGAITVGAQSGGLGKVPGFYYVQQNRENLSRLRRELRTAVRRAMQASQKTLRDMSARAMESSFPLIEWQESLMDAYKALQPGCADLTSSGTLELSHLSHPSPSPSPGSFNWFPEEAPAAPATQVEVVEAELTDAQEFFWQELTEEELSERVTNQLDESQTASNALPSIETILQRIGTDVSKEHETGRVAKWLTEPMFGTARVHWLVSCAYIACPLSSLLVLVVATEWGIRGSTRLPVWFPAWFKVIFGDGGLNLPMLNMLLFSINALAGAVGAPIWACLARVAQPRHLLAAAMLLQVPFLTTMLCVRHPDVSLATTLVFLQGLASSGSLMFVSFNFMMSIKADVSHAAYRMGILEMTRQAVTWFITAYIFLASPSTKEGTASEPLPPTVYWLLLPTAAVVVLATLIPGVLFWMAPGPYREDALPSWDMKNFWKKRSFVILSISDILGSLVLFPSTCYIQWWLANGWRGPDLAILSVVFAFALAGVTILWAKALGSAIIHGFALLIGVTLLLPPATMLRAIVQEEVSTFTFLGRSNVAVIICCLSLIFEGVRCSSAWAVKVRVLNSRWRLLSYGSIFISMQGVASFASPFLCEYLARRNSSTFISANEKELADAAVVTMVPLSLLQFAMQIVAAPWIRQDLGVASSNSLYRDSSIALRFRSWTLKKSAWRRLPPQMAILFGCVLGAVALLVQFRLMERPVPFTPVRRCLNGFQPSACELIEDETDHRPADSFAFRGKGSYGINRFGQSTTGKFNCQVRMTMLGGDTFVFWSEGRCQVWRCHHGIDAPATPSTDGQEVWSQHCSISGQNHIMAHLFEWPWPDIANECETYLGPAGFSVVQISPPMEHIIGSSWSTRYQPVSFKLDSRSGTPDEFEDMVSRCTKAGVSVMVDTVLNHMASPVVQIPQEDRDAGKHCGGKEASPKFSTTPCEGWSGTPYGNREFHSGMPGLDYFERSQFHHFEGNLESNCGIPPWTNNRYLCDLYGLVDLDTENLLVQEQLKNYIKVLFERGVTMLRLDAAMHVYPESFLAILAAFPFDYVVQEYYPDDLKLKSTLEKAKTVGTFTNFDFGRQVGQVLFDSCPEGAWVNSTSRFGDLLHIGYPTADCTYALCNTAYPPIDNHDQQRERWKPVYGGRPASPVCRWDGKDIGNCRPIYKHGLSYNLAQLFMLAWPYGDAVRLLSSYAFEYFDQGPPGVQNDSWRDRPLSPAQRCRSTPTTSPVTEEYDKDLDHPWVCEHRWQGVAGMVRFRRIMGHATPGEVTRWHTWSDRLGHVAFGWDKVAFVALNHGFNWETQQGSNKSWSLVGLDSYLPQGKYCNLAVASHPVPDRWDGSCFSEDGFVVVDINGTIIEGKVPSTGVLAIHVNFANLSNSTDDILLI